MNCDCIKLVNKELEGDNAALDTHFTLNFETGKGGVGLTVPVRRIDTSKRNKLPAIAMSYCPFCGKSTQSKKKKAKRKSKKKKAKA